jgi:hypothetical protein
MKSIINGKRYDTEKAIEIGGAHNIGAGASSLTDFQYWEATLYKTPRSGTYFLAGKGGPMTRYARGSGNNTTTWGARIDPMRKEEALKWAETYLDPEVVEKEFNDIIKDA